ncbi:MAG: DUF4062 domain-containing protein [Cyclobacteriaceae bacterium]|jgi:hypothetical protein|nr:DUF4062 domain-containing protein [Cyclobacteriaceae bacterium]
MAHEIDILITFAEKDNETEKKSDIGWVTQFKKFLELMLIQVLGHKPRVVLKSEFDTATSPNLDNAAVLVSVLTREFVQSGRCLDQVEAFHKAAASSKINRIFKVLKAPLTLAEQPPRLRDLIGYDMYQLDTETGQMKEYVDFFSAEAEKQYWMKLVDLAYDIHEALVILNEGEAKAEVRNIYKRKTIFLAETAHDLSVQRNIIKRELQRHGYVVLPKNTLPTTASELERTVRKDLEDSQFSIHLIGSAYGEIPEGSERSLVDLQNRLAAEMTAAKHQRKEEFARLIWIAPNLRNASERQKNFIDSLKRDTEAQEGAEILQNPLEDFKNIMREELLEAQERKHVEDGSGRSVYLLHDRIDHHEVRPLIDLIEKSGYRVLTPAFEGELLDVRKRHIDNLKNFDVAVIYKGKVNEQWVRMKVLDLMKAPGFGRKKPISGKAIIAPNAENYRTQNMRLIDPARPAESLQSYLQELNA